MTQKTNQNPWTMDVRVRERNLKSGALTDKDLEKYLANLPDLADQVEPFGTPQPALAQQPVVAEPAPVEDVEIDADADADNETDNETETEEAAPVEEIAAAPEPPPPPPPAPVAEAAPPAPQVEEPAPVADTGAVTNGEGEQS